MSKIVKTLDSTSGALFMAGLISGKLRYLPIPVFSSVIGFISLGLYLTGYLVWLITCPLYAHHSKMPHTWFGFLPIRQQHLLAASIGLIAISLCLAALAVPILGIAGSCLFAISNLFWNIAEYHRFKNPPGKDINPLYSHQRQAYYLSYATLATITSIMTAAILTASFFLAATPMITTLAAAVGLATTLTCIAAFYFLYKSITYQKPTIQPTHMELSIEQQEELTFSSSYQSILKQAEDETLLLPEKLQNPQKQTEFQSAKRIIAPPRSTAPIKLTDNSERSQTKLCF